jgi:hypothetical protein
MSDFSSIQVLRFSGKKDEWPIWSEKLLTKAKCSGYKDVLLGNIDIPKSGEEINEKTEEEKVLINNANLNEMAYTELILSIYVRRSSGKVMFRIIKGFKSRNYTDGNSALAWDKLKKKFDPVSALSLVKTERAFRQIKLEKGKDPVIWVTNLKEFF